MSMISDVSTTTSGIASLGTQRNRQYTWIMMMAKSFNAIDRERQSIAENGFWTARTNSIARYSSVDVYI